MTNALPDSQPEQASSGRWTHVNRAVRIVAIACAVGFALAAVAWWLVIPNYRPALQAGERYGIDVSHHQGSIDWAQVRSDGIDFAYIKATEGGDHTDRLFQANAQAARGEGFDIGAYHFFTFCRSGAEQATHFLQVAPPQPDWLPPALDIEYAGNCSKRPNPAELQVEVEAFVDIVEMAWGRPLIMYVLHDTEADYGIGKAMHRRLWTRRLFRRPGGDRWDLWQVSFRATVDGVKGPVDLNVSARNVR